MSSSKKSKQTSSVRLSPELRQASVGALGGAENIYNMGTEGIFQGSRLAAEDPLVRQAQEQQLALAGQGGDLSNLVGEQQAAFSNLLGAGNLEGNSVFQRQVQDALDQANVSFQRGSVPLFQQAAMAGQFGGSEGQEGLGLLGGEINRNMQQAITQAALGGQQTALAAQGLAPQSIGLGLMPSELMANIGQQRGVRSQAELMDEIQQFEAPRQAEIQRQTEYQNFLASNPLVSESTQTTTSKQKGSKLQTALGIASLAAAPFTGGASLGLGGLGSAISGGMGSLGASLFGGGGALSGALGSGMNAFNVASGGSALGLLSGGRLGTDEFGFGANADPFA